MKKRKSKRRGHPLVVVILFLGSAGVAARSFLGGPGAQAVPGLAGLIGNEEPVVEEEMVSNDEVVWHDLLLEHGSYDGKNPVLMAFAAVVEVEARQDAAAPAGESLAANRWRGEDPPMLRLGVIMVSDAARRAVLDGRVVGVGDAVGSGQVTGIDPGAVRLRWRNRELTYDLEQTAPREFRAEMAHRAQAQSTTGTAAGTVATDSQGSEERQ